MYEPMGSETWFKWSALTRVEKLLLTAACVCIGVGTVLTLELLEAGGPFYDLGYRLGSGGMTPLAGRESQLSESTDASMTIAAVLTLMTGGILWFLFSIRQNELFNRVQNRSYGLGSFITLGGMALWLAGTRLDWLPPVSAGWVVVGWLVACSAVWLIDARRLWQ